MRSREGEGIEESESESETMKPEKEKNSGQDRNNNVRLFSDRRPHRRRRSSLHYHSALAYLSFAHPQAPSSCHHLQPPHRSHTCLRRDCPAQAVLPLLCPTSGTWLLQSKHSPTPTQTRAAGLSALSHLSQPAIILTR